MKLKHFLATAVPTLLLASTAHAVRQPSYVAERSLEVAHGGVARSAKTVALVTPVRATGAWTSFLATRGSWQAIWDDDTGVPARIYGEGIPAPGVMNDAAAAERAARAALAENLALLAPGASVGDFVVEHDALRGGVRTVRFAQTFQGMPVVGGTVSFMFAHDRLVEMGSTASPNVAVAVPTQMVGVPTAGAKARSWVESVYHAGTSVLDTGAAQVLPIVRGKQIEYRVVVPVTVDQPRPRAQWTVYVDAASGDPVARHQRLLFASGTVMFHIPDRYPEAGYVDLPAVFDSHTVNGTPTVSDLAGLFSWAGTAAATVTPGLSGTYADVSTATGATASGSLTVGPSGTAVWDQSTSETGDAQLAAYINVNLAKQYARGIDPTLAWLDQAIPVVVNETDQTQGMSCNAFSNLDDIHFFVAAQVQRQDGTWLHCGNTGRINDVLFHEFGHSLHAQALGSQNIDGAESEGIADYYAATMLEDPDLGLGFDLDALTTPMRQADPPDKEWKWPDDVSDFDPHVTGQIISGALWDLRKAAIASMGHDAGRAWTDQIFYGIISRAQDIPDAYSEALVTDDDDGNLANGTPHDCMIKTAFGPHGLGDATTLGQLAPPTVDGMTVVLAQLPDSGTSCPNPKLTAGTIDWRLRSDPSVNGTVDFTDGGSTFTATLPAQADGEVIEAQVHGTLDNGSGSTFPQNPADPWYQLYVGPVTNLYCTDFESGADGWSLQGFTAGAPTGGGSNDPAAAFSGSNVIGINLNGDYQSNGTYSAVSPAIDTTGYTKVRLQYRRWLGSEDATYDHATIGVNGGTVWENLTGDGGTQHVDREWRFQDVDLSSQAASGSVQVTFGLTADGGVEFGGWNVDGFCIVAEGAAGPSCGDGTVDTGEQCDDGNTVDGDGCSATCTDEGGGQDGGCCSTSNDTPAGPILLGLGLATLVVRRRRRA